jgi:crossover junction endodeoxyribonuclease RuvC
LLVVGVDPGLHGGVAFLGELGLLHVEDMPIDIVEVNGKKRPRLSFPRLARLLNVHGATMFCEEPEARPIITRDKQTGRTETRTPGAAGMLALGITVGAVRALAAAYGMEFHSVRSGSWKKALRLGAGKDEARNRAAERFPLHAAMFARVKDDGRAESALIAAYGYAILKQGKETDR